MPRLSVTTTVVEQVKLSPKLKRELQTTLKDYAGHHTNAKLYEGKAKACRGRVEEIMEEAGETALEVDGFKATLIAPVRKTLNIKKLIAKGVSMDIIDACYDETPGTAYVKVTVPGAKGDDD